MSEIKYPITEIFTSPQGEGMFAGTLMTFIRFGGCSVGEPLQGPILHDIDGTETKNQAWQCCSALGSKFWCDTDFNTRAILTREEILSHIPLDISHVCLTGGEPLMHLHKFSDPFGLFRLLILNGKMIHIETSGTVDFTVDIPSNLEFQRSHFWITVSPKIGVLPQCLVEADEIKLLVDKDFNFKEAQQLVKDARGLVYLQPINQEKDLNADNIRHCLEWQKHAPSWRISLQVHKILQCR